MDNTTLGAAIGILMGIPNSNVARAEAAAQAAEEARDKALAKSYGITVQGTSLMITETTVATEGGDT